MRSDDIRDLHPFVQLEVARSPFADPEDLAVMADDPEAETSLTLAELGVLPVEAVLAFARHADTEVRVMLVRNTGLAPAEADLRTALLVDDPSPWVRSELLALDLPVALRRRVLAGLADGDVLHPQEWMSEDLLGRMLTGAQDDEHLRAKVIWCLPADSALLRALSASPDPAVRLDVACNPVLPEALRRQLAADEDADVRRLAVERDLGTDVLLQLSLDPDAGVREAATKACRELVASGTRAGQDAVALEQVLARAAHDPDEDVRAEAALHAPLQAALSADPSERVRCSVASTSPDPRLLERLADDPEPEVTEAVLDNPQAPPVLLQELCRRLGAAWARRSGLGDDEQPDETSAPFLAMHEAELLARLVAHPALPDEVAAGLLLHRSPTVGDAALVRLGHDPDVVPAQALRLRHRRGLLWRLLAQAGAPVHDPAVREAVLERLPAARGSVSDLATALRRPT